MRRFLFIAIPLALLLAAAWIWFAISWSYASGERAGWVQKFSKRGWICKTWEGELAMVSLPGSTPEKFFFTVWDPKVAAEINQRVGQRVALHYEQKIGLPGSCFGDTRYWVTGVTIVPEIPLGGGMVVPLPPNGLPPNGSAVAPGGAAGASPAPAPAAAPGPTPASGSAPAPAATSAPASAPASAPR